MTYSITPDQLPAFEQVYNEAVVLKKTYFIFNRMTYMTELGFYVIEYFKFKEMALSEGLSLKEVDELVQNVADHAPNSRSFILKWWELKKEELQNDTEA